MVFGWVLGRRAGEEGGGAGMRMGEWEGGGDGGDGGMEGMEGWRG